MPKRRWHPRERARLNKKIINRDGDWCVLCVLESGKMEPIADATIDHLNNDKTDNRLPNLHRLCHQHNSAEGGKSGNRRARILTPENLTEKRAEALELCRVRGARAPVAPVSPPSGGPQKPPVAPSRERPPINNSGRPGREPVAAPRDPRVTCECVGECVCDRNRVAGGVPVPAGEGKGGRGYSARIAHVSPDRPELDTEASDAAILEELMNPLFRLWVYFHVKRNGSITKAGALDAGGEFLDNHLGRGNQITVSRYFKKLSNPINGWLVESRDARNKAVYSFRPGVNLTALRVTLRGRVDALNVLLVGRPLDLSEFPMEEGERDV